MTNRRGKRAARATGATISLDEAATLLGVPPEILLEAIEEAGIRPATAGKELRLETAEVERYGRLVEQSQARARDQLSALRDSLE